MIHERHKLQTLIAGAVLAGLAFVPLYAWLTGDMYVLTLFGRILAFSLAALGLNLALGFGGMVSLGHAMYMGLGAYTVGILSSLGVFSGWIHLGCTAFITILIDTPLSWVALRTQGIAFIMITLAFAQMVYYLVVSFKAYGGDDGLPLLARSRVGMLDMSADTNFYYITLAICLLVLVLIARLLNARFGHVLQAIRDNETRMQSLGYAIFNYKLCAFTLSGAVAGLAGALLANQSGFVSPAMMQWSQSGMLMMMVILGGVGHLYGGVWGAVVFLLLEEWLSHFTIHWQLGLGALLLAVVLIAPNGLTSVRNHLRKEL